MSDDLWETLWRGWTLISYLRAIEDVVKAKGGVDRDAVRIDPEGHPKPVRAAMLRWAHQSGCEPGEVPILPALEAAVVEQMAEVRRAFFRRKGKIIVVENSAAEKYLEMVAGITEDREALADYLEVELFTSLPEMLKRASRVQPLIVGKEVPTALQKRYREAVRSYLFRHPMACCALCRAIVEAALKDALESRLPGMVNPDRFTFGQLVGTLISAKVLPEELRRLCEDVKNRGDIVLHREEVAESDSAHASLLATQQILKALFPVPAP